MWRLRRARKGVVPAAAAAATAATGTAVVFAVPSVLWVTVDCVCVVGGGIFGIDKLVEACKEKISENENDLSVDKSCSWMEVECLGACVNAPMMQINDDYYEDLDKEKTLKILDEILDGKTPKPGSYRGRVNNEPENNRKTLLDLKNA